jgi:hypothetical protein
MSDSDVYSVEYVSDNEIRVQMKTAGSQKASIRLSPDIAAELGHSLLAASAVCSSAPPKPSSGTRIRNAHFPVTGWETGKSSVNGQPVLLLKITGGATLVFQFASATAQAIGGALRAEGEKGATTLGTNSG